MKSSSKTLVGARRSTVLSLPLQL